MAIYINTSKPRDLLAKFNAAIKQTEAKGKITTWEFSADGNYYTHKASAWAKKAWLKPVIEIDKLRFNIIRPKSTIITQEVYAYYHGHLIETFLNHFSRNFTTGEATALPQADDKLV